MNRSYLKFYSIITVFIINLYLMLPVLATDTIFDSMNKELADEKNIEDKICEQQNNLKNPDNDTALTYCLIAELMKRIGSYEAEEYYQKAIALNDSEAAYKIYYADYLRNYRGAMHPLFPEAQDLYFEAQGNLEISPDDTTERRLKRSLIALYESDGLSIFSLPGFDSISPFEKPTFFYSTTNRFEYSTNELDEIDDVREFTCEALFAEGESRLNRKLTDEELQSIIRRKAQFETTHRVRIRNSDWPVLDVYYKYREIDKAQLTNFFDPYLYNDVTLNTLGIAVEKPFNLAPLGDLFIRGRYERTKRRGNIEFLPREIDDINLVGINTVFSRYIGRDKLNMEFDYVFQDINPHVSNPPNRERHIFGGKIVYQLLREKFYIPIASDWFHRESVYNNLFENRGIDLFGGVVFDREVYGRVDADKNNFFIGSSFKAIDFPGPDNSKSIYPKNFDITVQHTLFTAELEGGDQDNTQLRTNWSVLFRLIDEEQYPEVPPKEVFGILTPAFLHFVIPFQHDLAVEGPDYFENFKMGCAINTKLYNIASFTSVLLSFHYDYQRFYRQEKTVKQLGFTISMGF